MTSRHGASRPAAENDGGISISVRPNDDGAAFIVCGELDIESATHLRTALLQAMEACVDGAALTMDLSQVTFCDSTGLNELLRARRRALNEHRLLTITTASPQMTRLLEMTGAAVLFAGEV
ncbi:STAS domain-containing protein [Streptomyces sp. NPDC056944]|uniref:STAS domain-containing protein n=1 Tax=Streptomyces sp. NPDC056944 TaxID=3345972 RepID=UPI003629EEB8